MRLGIFAFVLCEWMPTQHCWVCGVGVGVEVCSSTYETVVERHCCVHPAKPVWRGRRSDEPSS